MEVPRFVLKLIANANFFGDGGDGGGGGGDAGAAAGEGGVGGGEGGVGGGTGGEGGVGGGDAGSVGFGGPGGEGGFGDPGGVAGAGDPGAIAGDPGGISGSPTAGLGGGVTGDTGTETGTNGAGAIGAGPAGIGFGGFGGPAAGGAVGGGAGGGPTAGLGGDTGTGLGVGLSADAGINDIGIGDPNSGLFGNSTGPMTGGTGAFDAGAFSGLPSSTAGLSAYAGLTGGPDIGVPITTGDNSFNLPNTTSYGTNEGMAPPPGAVSALANAAADTALANQTSGNNTSALNAGLAAIGAGLGTPTGTSIGSPTQVGLSGSSAPPASGSSGPPSSGVPGVPGPAGTPGDTVDPGIFTGSEVVGGPPATAPPSGGTSTAGPDPASDGSTLGINLGNLTVETTGGGVAPGDMGGGAVGGAGGNLGAAAGGGGGVGGRGGRIIQPPTAGASGGVELQDGTVVPTGTMNEVVFLLQQAGDAQPSPAQVQSFQQIQASMIATIAPQFGGNFQSPDWLTAIQQINQQAALQAMQAAAA